MNVQQLTYYVFIHTKKGRPAKRAVLGAFYQSIEALVLMPYFH